MSGMEALMEEASEEMGVGPRVLVQGLLESGYDKVGPATQRKFGYTHSNRTSWLTQGSPTVQNYCLHPSSLSKV